MSLYKNITLFICKTKCYKCSQEYNTAYKKVVYDESYNVSKKTNNLSPESFSDEEKEIAKENDVIIEKRGYGYPDNINVFTVNVCPHCRAPFGNNHIDELEGKEIKEIKIK